MDWLYSVLEGGGILGYMAHFVWGVSSCAVFEYDRVLPVYHAIPQVGGNAWGTGMAITDRGIIPGGGILLQRENGRLTSRRLIWPGTKVSSYGGRRGVVMGLEIWTMDYRLHWTLLHGHNEIFIYFLYSIRVFILRMSHFCHNLNDFCRFLLVFGRFLSLHLREFHGGFTYHVFRSVEHVQAGDQAWD